VSFLLTCQLKDFRHNDQKERGLLGAMTGVGPAGLAAKPCIFLRIGPDWKRRVISDGTTAEMFASIKKYGSVDDLSIAGGKEMSNPKLCLNGSALRQSVAEQSTGIAGNGGIGGAATTVRPQFVDNRNAAVVPLSRSIGSHNRRRAKMTEIKIITTGGTIDKIYFDAKSAFQVGAPQIGDVLKEANVTRGYDITPLMRKDSLDLTDADRHRVYTAVRECPQRRVIVTHGTDTMTTTAAVLRKIAGKTIVLTGAMQPAKFRLTDAVFNIASAFTAVQLLPAGVYIAMNGRIFDPETARKNPERHRFEVLESQ
jgi:L-asparaginase